jgi:predicted metal-dependent peptidase
MNARQKVQAARTALVLDQPFYGVLSLRLRIVEDVTCDTAWTDGVNMGYSPDFINSLPTEEILGVVAHEVMHCANGHPWRRDGREPRKFNVAADLAINYVLEESGFKLPAGRLREKQFDGKSVEWIYERIPSPPPVKGCRFKPGDGDGGKPGDGPSGGGQDQSLDVRDAPRSGADSTEAEWQQAVQQAAVAAKARGSLPSCLERFAKAATEPRIDWRSVLHRFVQQAARADYSWRQPSTRYLAGGMYLPSLRSEEVGPIAVAVDTSGSIDGVMLAQFAAELRSVADDVRPSRIDVIYCDAKVHRVDTFERDDMVQLHAVGGGGTSFEPVMDHVDTMDEPPVCLIYLTDLYGSHRAQPPGMPVLWATTSEGQSVPYGEMVVIK